jgi:hypothetical protein
MGIFKKEENQYPVVEKKKTWKVVETFSFIPPCCHGKPMKVKAFNNDMGSYILQCEECGKVVEGEIEEDEE